jgi:hypothetical protein
MKSSLRYNAICLGLVAAFASPSFVPTATPADTKTTSNAQSAAPAEEIAAAAKKFLATLDDAQRRHWSKLPTSFVKRGGLRMGDLIKP